MHSLVALLSPAAALEPSLDDRLWWIPALPLAASVVCGLLHLLVLRQRAANAPKVADGHGAHGHGAHDHAHAPDAHAHDAHAAHADHGHGHERVSAGIGALAPVVAVLSMAAALAIAVTLF